jgi:hypothetical protein
MRTRKLMLKTSCQLPLQLMPSSIPCEFFPSVKICGVFFVRLKVYDGFLVCIIEYSYLWFLYSFPGICMHLTLLKVWGSDWRLVRWMADSWGTISVNHAKARLLDKCLFAMLLIFTGVHGSPMLVFDIMLISNQ